MAMGGILVLIGYLIGVAFFNNAYAGLILALVIWFIMNLVAYFAGDSILLGISKAKKITHDDHPRQRAGHVHFHLNRKGVHTQDAETVGFAEHGAMPLSNTDRRSHLET